MIKLYTKYFLMLLLIFAYSCTSFYSKHDGEPKKEKNGVTSYENPYLKKEINGTGWSVNIGVASVVGLAAYQYMPYSSTKQLIKDNGLDWSDDQVKLTQGIGVGLVTMLVNYFIMRDDTKKLVDDKNLKEWLKPYEKDNLFVDFKKDNYIKLINKSSDQNFLFENLSDAKLFKKLFPESNQTDNVILKSFNNFKEPDLYDLVNLFPTAKSVDSIKSNIILEKSDIDGFIKYSNIYEGILPKKDPKIVNSKIENLTKNLNDLEKVKYNLKDKVSDDFLETRGLTFVASFDDIKRYNQIFPNNKRTQELEKIGFTKVSSINDAVVYKEVFENSLNNEKYEEMLFSNIKSLDDIVIFKQKIAKSKYDNRLPEIGLAFVKNSKDIIKYEEIFPKNANTSLLIDKMYDTFTREDISNILKLVPFTDRKEKLVDKLVSTIRTIDDAIDVATTYPDKYIEISSNSAKLCSTVKDYRKFLTYFAPADKNNEIRNKYNEMIMKEPENLGKNINSVLGDYYPQIAPDGDLLFFVRRDLNKNQNEDIFLSKTVGFDEWGEAQNIGEPLNNKDHNAISGISQDGLTILLHNHYQDKDQGHSVSYRTATGWTKPKDLNIPGFKSLNSYHNACMSVDEKVILFSTQLEDSYGMNDLYVSMLDKNGNWSKPMNLGSKINTENEEFTVFLAADGETMYYSTNGLGGYGGSDIYISRRLDDTWTNWSIPENIGGLINTENDEKFYVIPASGDLVYYSSDNKSLGQYDIFRIGLPLDKRPKPVMMLTGKVFNKKTKEPMKANVIYEDLNSGFELGRVNTSPIDSIFKFILKSGMKYGVRAVVDGFFSINENLDLTNLKYYQRTVKDLLVVPIEKGQSAPINNIFFETAKWDLKEESFLELDRLVKILNDNPNISIEISGHTDDVGKDQANMKLSQNRANSVYNYLVVKGINKERLVPKGYGETFPIVPNDSDINRAKNRRVEVKFL